jgi:hypothetical protein
MPQSIRSLVLALTARQARLLTVRSAASPDLIPLIDSKLDELQEQIDDLIERFAK